MSLFGTLAKVAAGVMIAKGVGKMMTQGRAGAGRRQLPTGSGNGGLFDRTPPNRQSTNTPPRGGAGGIEDLLGGILGGGAAGGAAGGLGGLLEQLSGGATGAGGGLGGGAKKPLPGNPNAGSSGGSFGDLMNSSFDNFGEPETPPTPEQDQVAGLLLRAMIQAAKADGKIDEGEKKKLIENMGDVDGADMDFVNKELAAPVDVDALARDVPAGMEEHVYMMSVMAIDLDEREEAQYLHQLAQALNIGQAQANNVHEQLGVPTIYS